MNLLRNALSSAALLALALAPAAHAHAQKPVLSPPAQAQVTLNGSAITIHYNSPRMKGRKIMGGLVPWGQVWRTGANPAITLITPIALKIGSLEVPAGTYTLFTLPTSATDWKLIVSTKTGEWGIPYPEGSDLGRTPMHIDSLSAPQEDMSISFEKTEGHHTQLHVKWENTDVWVNVEAR
jgi:hypothetical protein